MAAAWFLRIVVSLCICSVLKLVFSGFLLPSRRTAKLPPGPPSFPFVTSFLWLFRSPLEIESLVRSFTAKYGPVVTLHVGPRPFIFIADRFLAHKALVQNAALFADRPPTFAMNKIISSNQHNIASAPYDPIWRLLRRNLTSGILHPSRVQSYSRARKWVLDILLRRVSSQSKSGSPVSTVDHFQFAIFSLLVLMCFGCKLSESHIAEIQDVQHAMLINLRRFVILNFWPKMMKILLRKRWEAFVKLRSKQEDILIPLIKTRKKAKQERANRRQTEGEGGEEEEFLVSYVDTLLDFQLPDEKRKLTEDEMVTICSEFLNASTDTTSTTLQWIIANLVKYPVGEVALLPLLNAPTAKCMDKDNGKEIKEVVGDGTKEVIEEDLGKLPYLKAVVLEGLRRHPPSHFVLPHAVKEDTMLENHVIPKNGTVNFMVAEMGRDPKVWEDPMVFKPERFTSGGEGAAFDIRGRKEIKMMPFGAGRRICPAFGVAMLHLEYFIANLVWRFEWKAVEGDDVDLSEKMEFTVVMNKPLRGCLFQCFI